MGSASRSRSSSATTTRYLSSESAKLTLHVARCEPRRHDEHGMLNARPHPQGERVLEVRRGARDPRTRERDTRAALALRGSAIRGGPGSDGVWRWRSVGSAGDILVCCVAGSAGLTRARHPSHSSYEPRQPPTARPNRAPRWPRRAADDRANAYFGRVSFFASQISRWIAARSHMASSRSPR